MKPYIFATVLTGAVAVFSNAQVWDDTLLRHVEPAHTPYRSEYLQSLSLLPRPPAQDVFLMEMAACVALGKISSGELHLRISKEQLFFYLRRR